MKQFTENCDTSMSLFQVFKQQILKFARPEEIDAIFSNITDIVELTVNLISSLEDTLEMAEEGQVGGRRRASRWEEEGR